MNCSTCQFDLEYECSFCDEPSGFCHTHYLRHLVIEHSGNEYAEREVEEMARQVKYPDTHPCKWHEGELPLLVETSLFQSRVCVDGEGGPGCGLRYLNSDVRMEKELTKWEIQ